MHGQGTRTTATSSVLPSAPAAGSEPGHFTHSTPPARREIAIFAVAYCTVTIRLSEWLLNSGAYMHWMLAYPV